MSPHLFQRLAHRALHVAVISLVAVVAAPARAQGPEPSDLAADPRLREIQEEILAGDVEQARARITALESAAAPAESRDLRPALDLLAAASSAPLARPDAMLVVAEKWSERREGEVALVAGLAAWMALRDEEHDLFAPLLPSCPRREIAIDAKELAAFDSGSPSRRAAFQRAIERLERRRDADGDLKRRALVLFTDLDTSTLEPIRLRSSQALLLPRPRLEAVRIRIDRLPQLGTDLVEWFTSDHAAAPALDRLLEPERGDDALPPLAPGIYGVELRSPESGWTGMRELLVSDLDLLVDSRGDACVVLALLNGRAQPGVEVTFDDDGAGRVRPEVGRTGPDGTLLLHLDGGRSRIVGRCAVERGEQVAVFRWPLRCGGSDVSRASGEPMLVHWMVDAPLHRRGETVRRRIVAHDVDERPLATPDGTHDVEPLARPLADEALVLRFWPGSRTERTVRGRSDADGLLAFELPLDDDAPLGPVPVLVERDGEHREATSRSRWTYDRETPFSIEAVKRPPLLLEVGWPAPFASGAPRPAVRIAARLPSGAPAGELAGTLSLSLGSFSESHDFRLDPGGNASLPIACDTLPAAVFSRSDPGELHLSITAPDGQVVEESGVLKLVEPATDGRQSTSAEDDDSLRFVSQSDPARAGEPVELEFAGPKEETLLVTAGRAEIWWHQSLRLDDRGRARLSIATRREWQPGFYVRAAALRRADRSTEEKTTWISFPRPGGEVRAELDEHDARFAPGTRRTLHVTTRDEEGRPAAALVSVAIVDESLFLLSEDRTVAPWRRLLPSPRIDRGDVDRTQDAGDPLAVLGPMFELGRMRRPVPPGLGGGGDVTPGLGGGGSSTSLSLRDDLRPIAAFIPRLKTGADGRASFTVDLPDDLTRWRVTLVTVSDDGHGEITKSSITTVRDPSVLVVAPRFLRSGDELAIPAVANTNDGPPRSVVLRADASPEYSLPGARELSELAKLLSPGAPITKSWRLRADAEASDHAWFALDLLDAESGVRLDGERRELPIVSRTIERPCAATAIVRGGLATPIVVAPPTLADALSSRVTVELLGDRAALLDSASRWLAGYPYGCAEQTISRLVPIFAAARASNLGQPSGAPRRRPDLTSEQARRFESGMARLRDMKSPDGYAWWPGGHADAFMTPVILTGLALAREAGLDPDAYRAVADLRTGMIRECVAALAGADGDPRVAVRAPKISPWIAHQDVTVDQGAQLVAEMAVAVLRLLPADLEARDAVSKLVASDAPLSSSLLFRAGLALVRAGNRDAAALAFERATDDTVNPRCVIPLEAAPEALAAERLELARALGRPRAEIDAAEAELLGLFDDDRFGTTWTTALALCALAGDGKTPERLSSDSRLVVRAGGREQVVQLDGSNRRHALLELGDVANVELSSPAPTHVVAVATRRHAFDGVTTRGWSEPLHVERTVSRWSAKASPDHDDGGSLETMGDGSLRCRAGDVLEVEVNVTGPADLTYFVVTCPIPAGCELVGRGEEFERTGGTADDARLIWAFSDLAELGSRRARARLVVAHAGVVGWPAAQAEAMYRPGTSGAGRGSRLVVGPAIESPRADAFTWLTPEARAIRRDDLVRRAIRSRHGGGPSRSSELWALRSFPDEVAPELSRRLDPFIVEWEDDVETLLELLDDRRATLLDGRSLSQLVAQARWHDVPIGRASLEKWASALKESDEGRALIDRWRRDDPSLGPIEKRIAAAATIEGFFWFCEPIDPERTLRTLRALDFAGDEPLAEVARAEREWLLESNGLANHLDRACREIVEHEGIRTQPRDPAAFAPLAHWQELLDYVREELDGEAPRAETLRLAGSWSEWKIPELLGAAPFPEERAIASSIASLRASLASALVRSLQEGEIGRFDFNMPGSGLLQSFDRADAESWLLACIEAADGRGDLPGIEFVQVRIREYEDAATLDSPLGRRLVEIAEKGPLEWCEPALRALPVDQRARLPIALLATRRGDWSDPDTPNDPSAWLLESWRVDALALSAEGRATVLAAIKSWDRGDARAAPLASVLVKCTAAELAMLPEGLLLDLFPELSDEACDCVRNEFVRRARGSRAAAEALAEQLAEPQDRRTRELLVEAVAAADGVEVIWDGDDPTADRYQVLLAARRGDAEAQDELRRSIRETHRGLDPTRTLPSDELLVAERTLLTRGTTDDLDAGLFEEVERAEVLARFGRDRHERERTIDWPRELIERGVALR
jgi:alpha-2-macroglobulin family protein/alpha-2-macroglobulin-like protein